MSLVFGACLAAVVELCVFMYTWEQDQSAKRQALWMKRSLLVQSGLVVMFFGGWPLFVLARHWGAMTTGGADNETSSVAWAFLGVVLFLCAVEVQMISVKIKVWAKKAREAGEAEEQGRRPGEKGNEVQTGRGGRSRSRSVLGGKAKGE